MKAEKVQNFRLINLYQDMIHPNKSNHLKFYIVEFILLFSAVTLGFFAENYRQSLKDRKTERLYLESLVSDLAQDTLNIDFSINSKFKGRPYNLSEPEWDPPLIGNEEDLNEYFYWVSNDIFIERNIRYLLQNLRVSSKELLADIEQELKNNTP
jgi:hypothetical protein